MGAKRGKFAEKARVVNPPIDVILARLKVQSGILIGGGGGLGVE